MECLHVIPRKIAKERGFKRFFLPQPCKLGHIEERNTKSSTCLACDKLRKVKYRDENPEKARACVRVSSEKNRPARREANREWRNKNKDYVKKSKREYVEKNREKVLEAKRRYYQENKEKCLEQGRAHKAANKERYQEMGRRWREKNRVKVRLNNRKRKERIKNAEGDHTAEDIINLMAIQKRKCAGCFNKINGENYHVDHVQPITLGGTNWPSNLQILCPTCNMSKGGRPPEEFYQKRGFLL